VVEEEEKDDVKRIIQKYNDKSTNKKVDED